MTVSTEVSREEYIGNGVTTDFDYRFRIFEDSDLVVTVADTTGSLTTLTLNTDYTVTGVGSRNGGKVKLASPLALSWRIEIERVLPATQESDVRNQGNFFPEVHEDAWDKLTMLIQQTFSRIGLALLRPSWLSNYYDAKNYLISNLHDPEHGSDAATAKWVEALAGGAIEGTLRADLARSNGSTLVGYRDTNVYTALDRLYRSIDGVVTPPQWQPVQGVPAIKLTGGLYSFHGVTLSGTEQTVFTSQSTICIAIKADGVYEARDRYPYDGAILVAHVRNGTLVEVVGSSGKSAFGTAGTPVNIPWMPGELRKIGEHIPIYVAVTTNGSLAYKTDYDVAVKKAATGIVYYVDRVNGSDTTGDGTQANPFQRIRFAIEKTPLARTIMIRATGEYTRDFTWNVSIVDRDLDFIGYDGRPVLSNVYPNPAWVAVPGSAGVYSFTAGLVLTVADYKNLDVYGHAQVLTAVNSVAACAAQPGSRYTVSGTTYIHLFDSRTPDADARLILEMTNGRVQDNSKIYIENLEFRDSFRGFQAEVRDANKNCYVYAKNCIFGLTATVNSYNSLGANSIMQNCVAQYGMQDAFNYHSDTLGLGKKPWFIEINCIGRWSGFDLLPNNNGSTAHDGVVGVRVNGEYYGTYGRVVHDVHDGTVTANFSCYAHDSSRSDFIGGACFTAGQGSDLTGKAKIYLYGCFHSGPNASITRDGLSEVWIFDTPIGVNAQYTIGNPYKFIM